ncbi:poly(3-hydroxybutyrate) depolymerase [Paraburkholderia aromaticivorans]|uniref:poly(3-hydroxybutyrate) depolymerase n=1 Tax=Paraburkholderia aromaticivorans TaxID=2026199 RepID=UPI0014560F38|nr:poly(3-hydroxybutyrate) depolymerase [Paraburkholderia aromaticivorans]
MRVILSICAIALSSLSASAFADPDTYPPLPALNIDIAQTSVSGASDATVPRPVVNQVQAFYAALGVPAQSVSTVELDDAGHVTPPLNYGVACIQRESPFIGKCQVDGAKAILGWIYGPDPFASPVTMTPKGRYVRFGQTYHLPANRPSSFTWTTATDSTGWVYAPSKCDAGAPCSLHVTLHGCEQGQDFLPLDSPLDGGLFFGTTFVRHAGYTQWADSNRIVVLFPQAQSIPGLNPYGCWDWWAYTDNHFADQQGIQMRSIRNMSVQLTACASH